MIREEYNYSDVSDYLLQNVDLLIVGKPKEDERSHFFFEKWKSSDKDILILDINKGLKLSYSFLHNSKIQGETIDLCMGTPRLLRQLGIEQKIILLDLASLSHVLIMFLTKQLLEQVVPRSLFAAYIRPDHYNVPSSAVGFSLSDQVLAVGAIPGFAKRECPSHTLCAFLGFEGVRLNNILESVHNIDRFVPIVAFPSGTPQWYKITVWNCMDTLQSECTDSVIHKCLSESIFSAIELLQQNITPEEKVVLAPLGTRPHSMACAIFSCMHPHARIVYDYVVEHSHRSIGISDITVYHLSAFLQT